MKTLSEMQKEKIKEFIKVFSDGKNEWNPNASPIDVATLLKQSIQLAWEGGEKYADQFTTRDIVFAGNKGFITGLEKAKDLISGHRSTVINRNGPNDTEHTRLAELSLFQEISSVLDSEIASHKV